MSGRCSLGVGCDEAGVCYADAHGQPDQCGRPTRCPGGGCTYQREGHSGLIIFYRCDKCGDEYEKDVS